MLDHSRACIYCHCYIIIITITIIRIIVIYHCYQAAFDVTRQQIESQYDLELYIIYTLCSLKYVHVLFLQ